MLRSNSSRGCGGGGRPGAVPGRPSPAPSLTCSSSEPLARGLPPFPLGHQLAGPGQEQPAGPLGSHGRLLSLAWRICHPSLLTPPHSISSCFQWPQHGHLPLFASLPASFPGETQRSPVFSVPSTVPGRGSVACWEERTDGRNVFRRERMTRHYRCRVPLPKCVHPGQAGPLPAQLMS